MCVWVQLFSGPRLLQILLSATGYQQYFCRDRKKTNELSYQTLAETHVRVLNLCVSKYYLPDQVPLASCPFPWGSCPSGLASGPASGLASVLAFGPSGLHQLR